MGSCYNLFNPMRYGNQFIAVRLITLHTKGKVVC